MLTAILILTIFNTGLLMLTIGGLAVFREDTFKAIDKATDRIEADIEALGTAMFNMDSIKQKATMTGRCEL